VGDLGALLGGIGGLLVGLAAAWDALRRTPRGSDRESETAARIGVEAVQEQGNVTLIDPTKKPNGTTGS
jgi:hypothetical protein